MSVEKTLKKLYSLENKVILLTGAAGGICSVMAQTLAGAGAVLALCDVQEEAVQNLCRSLEGTGHTAYLGPAGPAGYFCVCFQGAGYIWPD